MIDVINKYCVYSAGCLNDTECRHCGHGKMLAKLYELGRADREKEICDFLKALIESDYSSKQCKLLNSDLLEMIKEQK